MIVLWLGSCNTPCLKEAQNSVWQMDELSYIFLLFKSVSSSHITGDKFMLFQLYNRILSVSFSYHYHRIIHHPPRHIWIECLEGRQQTSNQWIYHIVIEMRSLTSEQSDQRAVGLVRFHPSDAHCNAHIVFAILFIFNSTPIVGSNNK